MKINILGGGPAGLYFALLMKKLDAVHDVAIFERDPADNTYGWGIVLSEQTLASLRGADFETYLGITESAELWKNVNISHKGEIITVSGNDFPG